MVDACIKSSARIASPLNPGWFLNWLNTSYLAAILACFVTFGIVMIIGLLLGSSFGAFSIGWIVFGVITGFTGFLNYGHWQRWVMESIIIVSVFCNQVSRQSSNAGALISNSSESLESI